MRTKLFLSVLFFMMGQVVFGQARYNVSLKSNFPEDLSSNGCDSYYNAYFRTTQGTEIHIGKWKPNYGTSDEQIGSISINDITQSFFINGKNQSRVNHPVKDPTCEGGEWTNSFTDLFNQYQRTSYWTKTYGVPNWWVSTVRVTYYPDNLAIQSVSSFQYNSKWILTQNDVTTLNATAGFPADAYTWRYLPSGSTEWKNFPDTYQGKSTISFTGNELLKEDFMNQVGFTTLIAVWAKGSDGILKRYGDYIEFQPKLVAPKIISVTAQIAKCSNSVTSSVKITLDRPLDPGSYIEIVNPKKFANSGETINLSASDFDATNTYEWSNLDVDTTYHLSLSAYRDQNMISKEGRYYLDRKEYYYKLNLYPSLLQATLLKNGIYCNGGLDATLDGKIQGGTPPYNLIYSNKTTSAILASRTLANSNPAQYVLDIGGVKDLAMGTYRLSAKDKNGCPVQSETIITQPITPLSIVSKQVTDVSGYGLNNGNFQVKLKGGTYSNPSGYNLPQLKKGGITYNAQLINSSNNEFTFAFYNLPPGNYNFRAADLNMTSNSSNIKDSAGCLVKDMLTIVQPLPLVLLLQQTQTIVCNGDATASLTGHGKGGKQFTTGNPYTYNWSFSATGATYTAITGNDSTLNNAGAGFYKLQVKDQNNNTATQILRVTQPAKVAYTVTVKNVTCLNWTDGALTVSNISGVTAPYSITWPDGSHGTQITDQGKGWYTIKVKDALSCEVVQNIKIKDTLNEITLERGSYHMPHCYDDDNGSMGVKVTVASNPYTVLWNNGVRDTLLSHIKAGTYTVQVLNSNNCLKEAEFTLAEPNQIPLDLDKDRYLCIGQTADYDIAVKDSLYQYHWQGGSLNTNNTQVSLTLAGTYTATINDEHGCSRTEDVTIHRVNTTVASDFVISSQVFAGEEVFLVNLTQDQYTDSCAWEFGNDPKIEVVKSSYEYATLIFKEKGNYKIGLKSRLGECVKMQQKEVIVLEPTYEHKPHSGATSFIKDFEIRPNPNDGHFEVKISLEDVASVKLRLLDYYSKSDIQEFQYYDQKDYTLPIHVTVAPGTYILFLETQYGTRIAKVVIMQ